MVVLLASLESLIVLALPLPTRDAGAVVVAILFPLPTPVDGSIGFRVIPRAFPIPVNIPAAPPLAIGPIGFSGETGRASCDFPGDIWLRTGERGRVRELAERGERTFEFSSLARDVVRSGGAGAPRLRFLGFGRSSFSLSVAISSLKESQYCLGGRFCTYLRRFLPCCGDGLVLTYLCASWTGYLAGDLIAARDGPAVTSFGAT
jgi:hypothetical protein